MGTTRIHALKRGLVTASSGLVLFAVLNCSSDAGKPSSCILSLDGTTQTLTAIADDGVLTETIARTATSVSDTLTIQISAVPFLSMTAVWDVEGNVVVDATQRGEPNVHLQGSAVTKEWTGTVGGIALAPYHAGNAFDATGITLSYADGTLVRTHALDTHTSALVATLVAEQKAAGSQCSNGSSSAGEATTLGAVNPSQENPSTTDTCISCGTDCDKIWVGCQTIGALGCLAFLTLPFPANFIVTAACELANLAVCLIARGACHGACDAPNGRCCPVTCGTDSFGSTQCCNNGSVCMDASAGAGTCCPQGHTQKCGTPSNGLCCLDTGTGDTCVTATDGTPSCCPSTGSAGPRPCNQNTVCCGANDKCVNGSTCCPENSPNLCGNNCCRPGQTECVGTTCCAHDKVCAAGSECCQGSFECEPLGNGTTGCICSSPNIPCGAECCPHFLETCAPGNPASGVGPSCCPLNAQICGGLCCRHGCGFPDANGNPTCCDNPCGTFCCQSFETCTTKNPAPSRFMCCSPSQTVCSGRCCDNGSPCASNPDTLVPICCPDLQACGPKCCPTGCANAATAQCF